MVGSGQSPVGAVARTLVPGWAGIGTTTLRELSSAPGCRRPLLLDRHLLILVTAGHGTQEVDFRIHQCRPGTLLRVRPGQVIRYGRQAGLDAVVICWDPDLVAEPGTSLDPFGPVRWQLVGEDEDAVINEVSQLVVDAQRHSAGGLAAELLRQQLSVLLLRLALLPRPPERPAARAATFQRLRQELERWYGRTRRVEDYAGRLGCSVRTLTRACLAATGRSAKQVIDDRVTLQAMRLLAATDGSISDIGRRLGFPEPTNFGRFFQREVGRCPGAFRADPCPARPGAATRPTPWRVPSPPPRDAADATECRRHGMRMPPRSRDAL